MTIDNSPVFPHPPSQNDGLTLFDSIMLAVIASGMTSNTDDILKRTKMILQKRNEMIQKLQDKI